MARIETARGRWRSVATAGNSWQGTAMAVVVGRPSQATSSHPKSSGAIRSHQKPSEARLHAGEDGGGRGR